MATNRRNELECKDLVQGLPARSLTYSDYMELMKDQAAADPEGMAPEDAEKVEYTKLNLHRSGRIGRTWRPTEELTALADRIDSPQVWMVLTEPWCGDSAQCLPAIATLAAGNPLVDLRIVLRDQNLEIMDQFLTNGTRSIPQLVILTAAGEMLTQWGPRPAEAQNVFDEAKHAGLEKPQIQEKLHLWYGRDRGRALDQEFIGLLAEALGRIHGDVRDQ
jgi:Thioredoxin